MSVRKLITDFAASADRNAKKGNFSAAQRRQWLKNALAAINEQSPIADKQALIEIKANAVRAVLPLDYYTAKDEALLAVEYGYSKDYLSSNGISTDYADIISAPIADTNGRRVNARLPKPEVTRGELYGVTHRVLNLHNAPANDHKEVLLYYANHRVEDPYWQIIIKSNPVEGEMLQIGELTYTATLANEVATGEFKVAAKPSQTAENLATAITARAYETGIIAIAQGQVVKVLGKDKDLDFTIVVDGEKLSAEYLEAVNTLDSNLMARVVQWMQAEQAECLGESKKAERLFRQAMDGLVALTI